MITSASTATAESSTVAAATSTASTASALTGLGLVDLDLLPVQGGSVHLADGGLSRLLVLEGDEGVALAGVVDIRDGSELVELALRGEIHVLVHVG